MEIVLIVLAIASLFGASVTSAAFLFIALVLEDKRDAEKNDLREIIDEPNDVIF